MITKKNGVDFHSINGSLTLPVECLGSNKSGWTIKGDIQEDYFEWVDEFEAEHNTFGKVYGNFQDVVYAESEEAFRNFWKKHKPNDWNHEDI